MSKEAMFFLFKIKNNLFLFWIWIYENKKQFMGLKTQKKRPIIDES